MFCGILLELTPKHKEKWITFFFVITYSDKFYMQPSHLTVPEDAIGLKHGLRFLAYIGTSN